MKRILLYIAIILGVVALDQVSKGILIYLITGGVPLAGNAWDVVAYPYLMTRVADIFNIVFTWNPGASFSLFRAVGDSAPIIMIFATSVIIGAILYYLFRRGRGTDGVAVAMIAGGAIGNLIDRIRFGAVVDFLDFHIGTWHWPAFNFADCFIVIGVGICILNWFINWRKGK